MYNYHHYVSCRSYGLTFFSCMMVQQIQQISRATHLILMFSLKILHIEHTCASCLISSYHSDVKANKYTYKKKSRSDYCNWFVTSSMIYCQLGHDDLFLMGKNKRHEGKWKGRRNHKRKKGKTLKMTGFGCFHF